MSGDGEPATKWSLPESSSHLSRQLRSTTVCLAGGEGGEGVEGAGVGGGGGGGTY